jgi:hypothetical protein
MNSLFQDQNGMTNPHEIRTPNYQRHAKQHQPSLESSSSAKETVERRSQSCLTDGVENRQQAVQIEEAESDWFMKYQQDQQVVFDEQNNMISRLKHELEITQTALTKIQTAVLSSSDWFQPAFDETILGHFNSIDAHVMTLANFLGALDPPERQLGEWPQAMLWHHCINSDFGEMPFDSTKKGKRSRRKVMTVVIWKFLDRFLFQRGFECFGGSLPQEVDAMYIRLFKEGTEPHLVSVFSVLTRDIAHGNEANETGAEESEAAVRWRAMTATQLVAIGRASEMQNNKVCEELASQLEHLLSEYLGYNVTREKLLENKLSQLLTKGVTFAQLLMEQRAIFKLLVPGFKEFGPVKEKDDEFRENYGGCNLSEKDEEIEGPVWFLIKPGLVKIGTGRGSKLSEITVLKKALVELAPEQEQGK